MSAPSLPRISWIVVGSLLLVGGHVHGQPGGPKKPLVDLYGDPLPAGAIARLGTLRFRNVDGFYNMGQSSLAWTPDGRFLVSGGFGPAVVWDAETGKEVRRLGSELKHPIGPHGLSPDGKFVAVGGSSDKPGEAAAVYELATGRILFQFGSSGQNIAARFSPDGTLLATSGYHHEIELLDASTGKRRHLLEGHGRKAGFAFKAISDAVFSPDNKSLISVGGDGTIRLWDVKTGKQTKLIEVDGQSIRQATLSPDGKVLAAISYAVKPIGNGNSVFSNDRLVRIWDLEAGKKARAILGPPDGEKDGLPLGAWLVGFTSEGRLTTRGGDAVMRVWDIRTGKELRHWDDKHDTGQVAVSPDDKKYAAIEGRCSISIRDAVSRQELVRGDGHRAYVDALAISPDGKTVATAANDNAIILWDLGTNQPRLRLTGHNESVRNLAYSPDGRTLYSVHRFKTLILWDIKTGKERKRIVGDTLAWAPIAVSPEGKRIAWSGREDAIVLLDATTGAEVGKLKVDTGYIHQIAFARDGSSLLAWELVRPGVAETPRGDRLLRWNIATGKRQETPCELLPDQPATVAFSPDRTLMAFGGLAGELIVAEVSTGREVRRFDSGKGGDQTVYCVAFSPDGRTLAWGGPKDGIVRLSELATGKERRRLAGHSAGDWAVSSLGFTPDGKHLVSGGADTTCLIWDLMGPAGWGDDPPAPLNDKSLAECWENLRSADAAKAYLSVRHLVADPIRAVPYLCQQLRPILAPDEKRIAGLLGDLGSEDFKVRDTAMRELEKTGDAVLAALRKAAAGNPSLETRRRIEHLVDKLDSMNETRLRSIRAIEALEYIGSADAERVLQALAKGAPGAHQTREARESLERIRKR